MRNQAIIATAVTLMMTASSYAQCSSDAKSARSQHDIVDTAVEAGQFKTLVAAVKAVGLVDVLKSDGPFTVFAPTDEAFAELPKGTLQDLLKPENKDKLTAILTYHVAPCKIGARDVTRSTGAVTANGQWLGFRAADGKVMVDEATVVKADIECKNGVIHVIDRVVLPEQQNIVQVAGKAESFKTLLTAATKAGLANALQSDGPFTVFAPTDEAFAKLPSGTLESLLNPENKQQLAEIIKYHVVPGRVYSPTAMKVKDAGTLAGQKVAFSRKHDALFIDNAKIVATDINASNGVIHVIDSVLLPSQNRSASADGVRGLIELAIDRGVPQFNGGNAEACVAIYEVAANSLLFMDLSERARAKLTNALGQIREMHDSRQRAWILRHALDEVYSDADA